MSEMVERVAKSICWSVTRYTYPILPDHQVDEMVENSYREKHWIKFAERAVTAMRDIMPKDVYLAGARAIPGEPLTRAAAQDFLGPAWRAMIDEALK